MAMQIIGDDLVALRPEHYAKVEALHRRTPEPCPLCGTANCTHPKETAVSARSQRTETKAQPKAKEDKEAAAAETTAETSPGDSVDTEATGGGATDGVDDEATGDAADSGEADPGDAEPQAARKGIGIPSVDADPFEGKMSDGGDGYFTATEEVRRTVYGPGSKTPTEVLVLPKGARVSAARLEALKAR